MSNETRLLLIRHGESTDNVARRLSGWKDADLTPLGRLQAETMAAHVAERYQPAALYSSPLKRALFTARALGVLIDREPVLHDDLRELHFGELEGLTEEEITALYPGIWSAARDEHNLAFAWPRGEMRSTFFARGYRAITEIGERHVGQTVAIVAHGGVISAHIAQVMNGQPGTWRSYQVDNCAITVIDIDMTHQAVVTAWNERAAVGVVSL